MRFWGDYYRYVVVVVSFLCLVSICSNYIIINFTFICMKDDMSGQTVEVNGTVKSIYDYTPDEKKYILWAVASGTIVGIFPVNWLYIRFGARWPFFLAGILSGITTVLTPYTAGQNFIVFLLLRFWQGIAYSADFAAIGIVIAKWAPLKETAIFIATLTSFTAIASIITNGASGLICESSLGWKWSFYLHALASFILFPLWLCVYTDNPAITRKVSKRELSKIQKNKSESHLKEKLDVPYMKIFTSPVILCVWLCAFTELATLILISTYTPIYFRRVLGFNIKETGFWLGVIIAAHLPFRFVCAFISDNLKFLSELSKILIFNTFAVGFVGISFGIFGYVPKEEKMLAVLTLGILEMFISFNCGGFYKCGTLHARQFTTIVISAIQFTKCLALFTGPALVAFFVTDETNQTQWTHVFLTMSVLMITANICSFFLFTDKPAEWTEVPTNIDDAVKYKKDADEKI